MQRKKVLVTGADGFIGSHFVETLATAGADVRAFGLYNASNTWGWLDNLDEKQLAGIEVLQRLTGWKPRTGLAQGLEQTISWFHRSGQWDPAKARLYHL